MSIPVGKFNEFKRFIYLNVEYAESRDFVLVLWLNYLCVKPTLVYKIMNSEQYNGQKLVEMNPMNLKKVKMFFTQQL